MSLKFSRLSSQDQDQKQDQSFVFFVDEAPLDQDPGLEDYPPCGSGGVE